MSIIQEETDHARSRLRKHGAPTEPIEPSQHNGPHKPNPPRARTEFEKPTQIALPQTLPVPPNQSSWYGTAPKPHVTEAGASDRGRARTNLGLGGAAVSVVGEPGGLGPRGGRGAPASGGGGVLGLGVGARVPGGGAAVALVARVVLGHLAAAGWGIFLLPCSFSNSTS